MLAENLPRLGIPSCYLALYENPQPYQYPQPAPEWSRLELAYTDKGRIQLEPDGLRFPSRQLVPKGMLPQDRQYSLVVMPLYFQENQIGFVLFEAGPHEGMVYRTLCTQISSALQGALLLREREQVEVALEQAYAEVEQQVEERTAELRREITERKQAEQALRESEERLRQIASSLREVIWLRDVQTRQVLYVNPAFEELTGRTCESFYENRDIVIDAIHPDDKEWVIKALDQRFEGVPFDKEHRIIHLDGSVRWVSSRSFPVRNEAGEVYRWASIMEDITERKQAEEEIQQAQ